MLKFLIQQKNKQTKTACEIHYLYGGEFYQGMRQKVLPKERLLGVLNEWGMRKQVRTKKRMKMKSYSSPHFQTNYKFSLVIIYNIRSFISLFLSCASIFLLLPGNKMICFGPSLFILQNYHSFCMSPAAPYQCRIFVKYRKNSCFPPACQA